MALSQGLKQYQGLVDRGLNFWTHAQKIWTDKSFNSTVDYYVHDVKRGWFPYFIGNQEGVSYVSLAPLAGDIPVVVWLRKESSENGTFTLVYYEIPVFAKSYRGIEWSFATGEYQKGRSVKLLEGADQVRFRYYGYDVRDEKHRWRDVHEGSLTKRLPLLVQIAYARGGEEKMFMFGINVNSNLRMGYEQQYGR
jgi:general secretion pathway protein J